MNIRFWSGYSYEVRPILCYTKKLGIPRVPTFGVPALGGQNPLFGNRSITPRVPTFVVLTFGVRVREFRNSEIRHFH